MDFVENVFKRMNLQQVSSFLLDGVENLDIDDRTYEDRLKIESTDIYKRLEQLYQDESEFRWSYF